MRFLSLRLLPALCILIPPLLAGCAIVIPPSPMPNTPCVTDGSVLNVGFYAYFEPVSHSASPDVDAADFNSHLGYEADLLSALEAMPDTGLAFARRGIAPWDEIWLQSAGSDFDLVGGGITILESRTRDAAGNTAVAFTDGHIAFRQSLLVRSADAARLARHDMLDRTVRVGALADTTGEHRLLVLTGLVDATGALAAGVQIEMPNGTLVADGSTDYTITAAGATPNLDGRLGLQPAADDQPQVIYLGGDVGEIELLNALQAGAIDAVARGEIGNSDAAYILGTEYRVTALDSQVEYGGFTLAAGNTDLRTCLNTRINWLTDHRRIGYADWRANPNVFMERAALWGQ